MTMKHLVKMLRHFMKASKKPLAASEAPPNACTAWNTEGFVNPHEGLYSV